MFDLNKCQITPFKSLLLPTLKLYLCGGRPIRPKPGDRINKKTDDWKKGLNKLSPCDQSRFFFIWHHFMAFILSLHIYMFYNENQHHYEYNFYYFLSISPYWPAAWVTFNGEELQLPLFLAATLFLECSMLRASNGRSLYIFTSFKSSLFFMLKILGSSLFVSFFRVCSLHASTVVRFAGAPFFVSFSSPNSSPSFLARLGRPFKNVRVGGEIRSLDLPI